MTRRIPAARRGADLYFTPKLFEFLRELKTHNRRDWFEARREQYEADVRGPMLHFIADLGGRLRTISPYFTADPRPVGGSMFRIHRDVRFSRDKSPYKTNVGAHFPHARAGRDAHAPGFYLHLEPGRCMGGGGLWHPDGDALQKVRARIAQRRAEWKAVRARVPELHGDSLVRVPAGYDAGHPFAEDLKRKDFYHLATFSDRDVCSADFMDRFVDACRTAAPLVRFMARALNLPF